MPKREVPVHWAPRIRPDKIRRLYQLDAQGLLDESLIDEVGYGLYSRCQSILQVADAMAGRVHCPHCDTIIQRRSSDPREELCCPQCGWQTHWEAYYATYHTQELGAGGARDLFAVFVAQWPRVQAPREKLVLIDHLIHSWHWETHRERPKFGLGRPTGVNLIEGNRRQVLALLDELTYGTESTPGVDATKATWRSHWAEVKARQAAGRTRRARRSSTHDPQ
jgi:hypothetical protein